MSFIEELKKEAKTFVISDQMIEKYIVESTVDNIKTAITSAINQNKNNILIIGCEIVPMDSDYDPYAKFINDSDTFYSKKFNTNDYLNYACWDYYNGGCKRYVRSLKLLYDKGMRDFCDKNNLDYLSLVKKLEDFDKRVISGSITLNSIEKMVYREVMNLGVEKADICMKFGWVGYRSKSMFSFNKKLLDCYKIYFNISW